MPAADGQSSAQTVARGTIFQNRARNHKAGTLTRVPALPFFSFSVQGAADLVFAGSHPRRSFLLLRCAICAVLCMSSLISEY